LILQDFIFLNNMFGQVLSSLTLTKPKIQDKNGQREYYLVVGPILSRKRGIMRATHVGLMHAYIGVCTLANLVFVQVS
jgi:hypothetical protein